MKLLILSFLISFSALGQITTAPSEKFSCPVCPSCPPCTTQVEEQSTATNRADSFGTVMGGFQFINTWVPSKYTGSYTQILSRDFSLELEYANSKKDIAIAGIDVGTLTEERITFLIKYYVGKTFFIALGPYINEISLDIGDDIVDAFGNRINDKAEINLLGVSFGIGNRWQFNNGFTVGFDWLRLNQPTGTYKVSERIVKDLSPEDADDVKTTKKLFKTIPSFTFFGLNIGYTF